MKKTLATAILILMLISVFTSLASAVNYVTLQGSASINSNFNGTTIQMGDYIWLNCHITSLSGVKPYDGLTIRMVNVQLAVTSGTYNGVITIPDGTIIYSNSVTTPTVTYDGAKWVTTVPLSTSGNIFITGLLFTVPTNFKAANPVVWSSTVYIDNFNDALSASGVTVQWQWSAAVYDSAKTGIITDLNTLGVGIDSKPDNIANSKWCIGGARGGGSSNFTGSWSGTGKINFTLDEKVQLTIIEVVVPASQPYLPTMPVTATYVDGAANYFVATLSNVPLGYAVTNGAYAGWCIDWSADMDRGTPIQVTLYSSLNPPTSLANPEANIIISRANWGAINYVLNNKAGASMIDITVAIWYFTGWEGSDPSVLSPGAQALIASGIAHSGFVPAPGQIAAAICTPN